MHSETEISPLVDSEMFSFVGHNTRRSVAEAEEENGEGGSEGSDGAENGILLNAFHEAAEREGISHPFQIVRLMTSSDDNDDDHDDDNEDDDDEEDMDDDDLIDSDDSALSMGSDEEDCDEQKLTASNERESFSEDPRATSSNHLALGSLVKAKYRGNHVNEHSRMYHAHVASFLNSSCVRVCWHDKDPSGEIVLLENVVKISDPKKAFGRREHAYRRLMAALAKSSMHGLLKLLFEGLISVNDIDELGHTPLTMALQCRSSVEIIRTLIDFGTDVNHEGPMGTPAQVAVASDQMASLRILVLHGADLTQIDSFPSPEIQDEISRIRHAQTTFRLKEMFEYARKNANDVKAPDGKLAKENQSELPLRRSTRKRDASAKEASKQEGALQLLRSGASPASLSKMGKKGREIGRRILNLIFSALERAFNPASGSSFSIPHLRLIHLLNLANTIVQRMLHESNEDEDGGDMEKKELAQSLDDFIQTIPFIISGKNVDAMVLAARLISNAIQQLPGVDSKISRTLLRELATLRRDGEFRSHLSGRYERGYSSMREMRRRKIDPADRLIASILGGDEDEEEESTVRGRRSQQDVVSDHFDYEKDFVPLAKTLGSKLPALTAVTQGPRKRARKARSPVHSRVKQPLDTCQQLRKSAIDECTMGLRKGSLPAFRRLLGWFDDADGGGEERWPSRDGKIGFGEFLKGNITKALRIFMANVRSNHSQHSAFAECICTKQRNPFLRMLSFLQLSLQATVPPIEGRGISGLASSSLRSQVHPSQIRFVRKFSRSSLTQLPRESLMCSAFLPLYGLRSQILGAAFIENPAYLKYCEVVVGFRISFRDGRQILSRAGGGARYVEAFIREFDPFRGVHKVEPINQASSPKFRYIVLAMCDWVITGREDTTFYRVQIIECAPDDTGFHVAFEKSEEVAIVPLSHIIVRNMRRGYDHCTVIVGDKVRLEGNFIGLYSHGMVAALDKESGLASIKLAGSSAGVLQNVNIASLKLEPCFERGDDDHRMRHSALLAPGQRVFLTSTSQYEYASDSCNSAHLVGTLKHVSYSGMHRYEVLLDSGEWLKNVSSVRAINSPSESLKKQSDILFPHLWIEGRFTLENIDLSEPKDDGEKDEGDSEKEMPIPLEDAPQPPQLSLSLCFSSKFVIGTFVNVEKEFGKQSTLRSVLVALQNRSGITAGRQGSKELGFDVVFSTQNPRTARYFANSDSTQKANLMKKALELMDFRKQLQPLAKKYKVQANKSKMYVIEKLLQQVDPSDDAMNESMAKAQDLRGEENGNSL
eukprot:g915.t1